MKTCAKCQIEKELDQFSRRSRSKDGLQPVCKSCANAYHQDWSALNHEYVNLKSKEWAAANRARRNEISARYRKSHIQQARSATRRSMAAKPEKYKAQRQAWEKADPARNAAKLSRRRTRKAGNGVFVILPKELRKLKTQPCIYCGGKAEHMDHITPISRGGRHSVGNLAPACAKCNLSKKDKFIIEWKVGAF